MSDEDEEDEYWLSPPPKEPEKPMTKKHAVAKVRGRVSAWNL